MKWLRYVLIGVILIGGGFAIFWLGVKPDAKPKPKLAATTTAASSGTVADPGSPTGTWKVQPGPIEQTYAGYRVQELLLRGNIDQEVTGRTNQVTGQFVVSSGAVSSGEITVKVDSLTTDSGLRDSAVKRTGLESSKFPTATFTLTQPVDLGNPKVGQTKQLDLPGTLTVRNVTKPATFRVDARWNGSTIDLAGSAPISLSDFGVQVGDFKFAAEVANNATIELQLTFARS